MSWSPTLKREREPYFRALQYSRAPLPFFKAASLPEMFYLHIDHATVLCSLLGSLGKGSRIQLVTYEFCITVNGDFIHKLKTQMASSL